MKKLLIALVLFSSCRPNTEEVSRGTYVRESDWTLHYYYNGIHYIKPKNSEVFINYTADSMYQEYNLQEEVNRTYPFDHSKIFTTSK